MFARISSTAATAEFKKHF